MAALHNDKLSKCVYKLKIKSHEKLSSMSPLSLISFPPKRAGLTPFTKQQQKLQIKEK